MCLAAFFNQKYRSESEFDGLDFLTRSVAVVTARILNSRRWKSVVNFEGYCWKYKKEEKYKLSYWFKDAAQVLLKEEEEKKLNNKGDKSSKRGEK